MQHDTPDFRATITGGHLTLVPWHANLFLPTGPAGHHFRRRRQRGVVIADLTVIRDDDGRPDELIAEVLSGRLEGGRRAQLLEWAASLGYRRLWLPGEVVEPPCEESHAGEPVGTRCVACRARWQDESFRFWEMVRRWGHFPMACPVCGCDLPQWSVSGAVR